MDKEMWKVIPNTNDMYYVSSFGRVYSQKSNKILKTYTSPLLGYKELNLCVDGKAQKYRVHRLVAQVFLDKPVNELYNSVNHIDGNKQNNSVSNLEWVTNEENVEHAFREGLHCRPRRKVLCVELNKTYSSMQDASKDLGISPGGISNVCRGKSTTYKGYTFRYLEEVK